jgi:predicted Zn-dependent protease
VALACGVLAALPGCDSGGNGSAANQGPGHRRQVLALTPDEELALGREAYQGILAKAEVLSPSDPVVVRVRQVGSRLVGATRIAPLMREINLREDGYQFEWEFNVIVSDGINAFCLPAGKVAVLTGFLEFVNSDDELATVLGHEMAHALAHHASERIAMNPSDLDALRAVGGRLRNLDESRRQSLISLLSAGAVLRSLSYNRFQESEADHIGVFLMTFEGYDPEAAVAFWERMHEASAGSVRLLEILSDHPTDERRLAQLQQWVPLAEGAKRAYDNGQIESDRVR